MAYVSLVEHPKGLIPRLAFLYGRHRFGRDVEPVEAAANHSGVLAASGFMETTAQWSWHRLDPHLALLVQQAVSGVVGCSWCIDFGCYELLQRGLDPAKVRDVPRWRDSDVYNERERAVLEYAEAVSATPAHVTDELMGRLHAHLGDPEIVELAAWVALENYRSRFNAGLGFHSQGFSENCQVPDPV